MLGSVQDLALELLLGSGLEVEMAAVMEAVLGLVRPELVLETVPERQVLDSPPRFVLG